MMRKHVAILELLQHRARTASEAASACTAWLVVEREAHRYLRRLQVWRWFRDGGPLDDALIQQDVTLSGYREDARSWLGRHDPAAVSAARSALGIRVAVVGKGGAGKTVIASTLARVLGGQGRKVLAADLDHVPGLAMSLGMGSTDPVPSSSVAEVGADTPEGWQLAEGVSAGEAVEQCAVRGPDGVRFLSMPKRVHAAASDARSSTTAVTQGILLGLTDPDWNVVGDLEAGATQSFQGHHSFCDDVVLVVGPAWRSALTARRLVPMFGDRRIVVVANRYRGGPDHPGLEPQVRIPDDPAVIEAERRGLSPFDVCPEAPAILAIAELARRLTSAEDSPA
jgi:CO dehydrogenase maturation factor